MDAIKSSADISLIFKQGAYHRTPHLTLIAMENEQHGHNGRVAFIAGKKLGNAVWRNRAKRRMRALCRDLHGPFPRYDVVFLARSGINDADYQKLLRACKKTVEQKLR